ncbi:MAG: FAD-dependent oxidoreductase, partial [Alphaproteobacteria bacterium]|nr:FAD-dependent oxidoreductase [Alphaproteobacteria bacterium]
CIGCNQGCLGGLMQGRIGCTVNVAAGNELYLGDDFIEEADPPRSILVVGGGPSGMEAARVAALRGHRVTIAEAQAFLGGTLRVAQLAPKHDNIGAIADWLETEIERLGVEVQLNTLVDLELIRERKPDAVILAAGATPRKGGLSQQQSETEIEGVDQDHVLSTWELFTSRHNQIGETALVFDDVGAYEAIGAAEFLIENGASVTFVTSQASFAPLMEAPLVAKPALDRLESSGRFTLIKRGVLRRIGKDEVEIGSLEGWPSTTAPAEQVVLVNKHRPNNDLAGELEQAGIQVKVIGDAGSGSLLPNAFMEGHRAGSTV